MDIIADLLSEVAVSVLADAAFLILEPTSEPAAFEADAIQSTLEFSGRANGTLRLRAARALVQGAAADMLGLTPDHAAVQQHTEATLRELANMLLGVFLARAFGVLDCPRIGLPASGPLSDAGEAGGVVCSVALVDMHGRPFTASILAASDEAA